MNNTWWTTRRGYLQKSACALLGAYAVPSESQKLGAAGPIVLGQSTMLTGPLAGVMTALLEGQQVALDEFNAGGGVGGRPVKLVVLDDAYDVKRCVNNVHRLLDEERVTALFGFSSTANIAEVLPVLLERKVPLIGVYAGAPSLRAKHHPYFFSHTASYRDEVSEMMKNMKAVGSTRVALAFMNNPFGKSMVSVVEEEAAAYGVKLVGKTSLEADASDAFEAAQRLVGLGPSAIIYMAVGKSLVTFVRAVRKSSAAQIYLVSVANNTTTMSVLGEEARGLAVTSLTPSPTRQNTRLSQDFVKACERARVEVNNDHFWGYLNMRVVLEQLRRAGPAVTSQSLVTTIEQMREFDIGGYTLRFGPTNHHGSSFVEIMVARGDGRFTR